MSDLPAQAPATLESLSSRLDDLLKEVRRQGRAAVAAQAAAESCLMAVRGLAQEAAPAASRDRDEEGAPTLREGAMREIGGHWLRALIPIADAMERVVQHASEGAVRQRISRRWWQRLLGAPEEGASELAALVEGLRVLDQQLNASLTELGVNVERPLGEAVDAERHRVVGVSPPRPGFPAGRVVEVVRVGYALGGAVVREAEVIASSGPSPESPCAGGNGS
ncbi:nucleotide exchange factor GrpE [Chondromyces crocatus]|uniref:Protein GrpE n=1 Tax=Chondromyces crocatus TaxID=52 RepID=A0A0K1E551_CHOCO|nr:nucleotide exchange factor GrpE [Chondromyces crocatus]AKT35979.1 uncharacterized protein CMC5_000910 [Chondromyces crocatus]